MSTTRAAREYEMRAEKNALGRYCAGLVKTGNAIYLDAGSTVLKIAEALLLRADWCGR